MLEILRGFAPWILYFIFSDPEKARWGALLALIALVVLGWRGLVSKKILDWVTLVFFLGLSAALAFWGGESIARYAFAAAGATLSLTALGSVAVGAPFTLQYARESVPQEYQKSPVFVTINRILSSFWGAIFAAQTALSLLYLDKIGNATLMNEILPNILTLVAVLFTARFPNWYSSRNTSEDA